MHTSLPAPALRQARLQLLRNGSWPGGTIDDALSRSWQRSLAAGLSPVGPPGPVDPFSSGQLRHMLAGHHELLAHSKPVMDHLFAQVRHCQSVVILADPRGVLLHTLGDTGFLARAERVALMCGASWNENQRGTNAIGTALVEQRPVEIHGAEHFLEHNAFLTCAAAPILSSRGELLGVLDISGDQRGGNAHTLGLVNTATRLIENRLLLAHCQQQTRLHLHASPEGIGSIDEGIVAVSHDGGLTGANRRALALLGLNVKDLGATLLEQVIDERIDTLLARHHGAPDQLLQVRLRRTAADPNTTPFFVRVDLGVAQSAMNRRAARWPGAAGQDTSASSQTNTAPTTPTTSRAAAVQVPAEDALARLDTGDARWRSAADKLRRISGKPIALLIQGESGVGKELFARAAHAIGPRSAAPFVTINCAALPENLIEAELFGYAPGAFTGARREGAPGRVREAHGGTLFLDEIGDMPLALQSRLLRVLQDRQVTPLGGGKAVDVDFALVCATHRPLRQDAASGAFRSDLYYRLNGLTVVLPALRERSDFTRLTCRLLAHVHPGQDVTIAADLLARLGHHDWPGNLRQYESFLRTASAMLAPGEACIGWQHLPDDMADALMGSPTIRLPVSAPASLPVHTLQRLTRDAVAQALENSSGNISDAARKLGISRQTLYRKMKG